MITPVAKVLRQYVPSFCGHLKVTSASRKQLVRLRIFCSFRIWIQKFCVCFCLRVVRRSLKRPKKLVWTERVCRSFWTQCLFIFGLFKNISAEWKTIGYDQKLMLFLNMDSEIGCLFSFKTSKRIFERPRNWFRRRTNRVFPNCDRSLCEDVKNCQNRWFCRANISFQNLISHSREPMQLSNPFLNKI